MFEGIKTFFLRRKLGYEEVLYQEKIFSRLKDIELKELEVQENRYKKALEDDDEAEWTNLDKTSDKILNEEEARELRAQAYKLYYRNAHARNIIRLFEKYVVGRKFNIIPVTDTEQVKEWWDLFWKINKMGLRKKEIVRRVFRDGETFLRYFKMADGMLKVRFMNPDFVKQPDDKNNHNTHGIETDPEDVETVKKYWYKDKSIDPIEVYHDKILVDSDVKRGRSYLEAIAKYIVMFNKWLNNRMKLSIVRAIVGLIRKVTGSPTQAANLATAYNTSKYQAPDKSFYHRAPEGVSIITANRGVDYELKSPNLQAADAQHDGRTLLLAISAGAGLTEAMVTSDAKGTNYASSLIAEAPANMEFQDWQEHFSYLFKDMFERVIKAGIEKNKIPQSYLVQKEIKIKNPITGEITIKTVTVKEEVSTECEIIFPEITHRDIFKETQALLIQNQQGWASNKTCQGRLDLDADFENEQIKKEMVDSEEDEEERDFERKRQNEIDKGEEDIKKGIAPDGQPQPPEDEKTPRS